MLRLRIHGVSRSLLHLLSVYNLLSACLTTVKKYGSVATCSRVSVETGIELVVGKKVEGSQRPPESLLNSLVNRYHSHSAAVSFLAAKKEKIVFLRVTRASCAWTFFWAGEADTLA